MKIEFTKNPASSDLDFLTYKINEETEDFGVAYPFAFFIRDGGGNIIAGCNGSIIFGCIYTDQLWVHKAYRQKGLGRALMEKVHDYGWQNQCQFATVNTMSFQKAEAFYEKLGYKKDFERQGYVQSATCFFLKKNL